jgi:hypothetical protein
VGTWNGQAWTLPGSQKNDCNNWKNFSGWAYTRGGYGGGGQGYTGYPAYVYTAQGQNWMRAQLIEPREPPGGQTRTVTPIHLLIQVPFGRHLGRHLDSGPRGYPKADVRAAFQRTQQTDLDGDAATVVAQR